MEKVDKMICNICGQEVRIRKDNGINNAFPVDHLRVDCRDRCHGFYYEGRKVK